MISDFKIENVDKNNYNYTILYNDNKNNNNEF